MRLLRLLLLPFVAPAAAYSVLTHQAVVGSTWHNCYPSATPAEQDEAKSYAYGGAIIQGMGYYPLEAALFTNLTVRSGDFVRSLLREARGRNEYAFSRCAGSLRLQQHGPPREATNLILPDVYPDKKARHGPVVTHG